MSCELEWKQGGVLTEYFYQAMVALWLALGFFLSWQMLLVITVIALNMVRDIWNRLPLGSWSELCTHCPLLHLRYLTRSSFITLSICKKVLIRIWGVPKSAWCRYGKHLCLHRNLFTSSLFRWAFVEVANLEIVTITASPDIARCSLVAKITPILEPLV